LFSLASKWDETYVYNGIAIDADKSAVGVFVVGILLHFNKMKKSLLSGPLVMLSKRVRYLNYVFHGLLLAVPVLAHQGIQKTANLQATSEALTWGSVERNMFYLSLILLGAVYYVKESIVGNYRESKRREDVKLKNDLAERLEKSPGIEGKVEDFADYLNVILPKVRKNNTINIELSGIHNQKTGTNYKGKSYVPREINKQIDDSTVTMDDDWFKETITAHDYCLEISLTESIKFDFEIKNCRIDSYHGNSDFRQEIRGFFTLFRTSIINYLFKDLESSYMPGFITKSMGISTVIELNEGMTVTPKIPAFAVVVDLAGYSTYFANKAELLSEQMGEYYLKVFDHFRENEGDVNLFKYRIKHLGDGHLSVVGKGCDIYETIYNYWKDHQTLVSKLGFPDLRIGISSGDIEFKVIKHGKSYDLSDESIEFTNAKRCEDFAKILEVSTLICDFESNDKTFYLGRYYLEGFEEPCDLYSYMFEHTGTLDAKEFNKRVRALFTSNSIEEWEKANSYLENLEVNIAVIELLCRYAKKIIKEKHAETDHMVALKKHKSIDDIISNDKVKSKLFQVV
jgi:hypothetical protein